MACVALLVVAAAAAMQPVGLNAPLRPAHSVRPLLLVMAASPDLDSDDDCHSILCAGSAVGVRSTHRSPDD